MKKCWIAFLIVSTVAVVAQTPKPTPERVLAVNALRVLNTAEVNYAHDAGHFGTWDDLRPIVAKWKTQAVKGTWGDAIQSLNTDSSDDPLPGWKLRITVAADGKHYTLSLHKDQQCDTNGFSDDSGVIYLGASLGCEKAQ
jgi:hypothetical protein